MSYLVDTTPTLFPVRQKIYTSRSSQLSYNVRVRFSHFTIVFDAIKSYFLDIIPIFERSGRFSGIKKHRARPGFEPGTSCTQSRNHTPRPTGLVARISKRSAFILVRTRLSTYAVRSVSNNYIPNEKQVWKYFHF